MSWTTLALDVNLDFVIRSAMGPHIHPPRKQRFKENICKLCMPCCVLESTDTDPVCKLSAEISH